MAGGSSPCIRYNVLNLPDTIQFTAGHQNYYTYDASGNKLEVQNITSRNILNLPQDTITRLVSSTKLTTDYCGDAIYQNDTLKEVLTPEGYWQNGLYYYYLKDHQGNTRVVINSSGVVQEYSNYYPDGMRFWTSTSNSAALPYRYNGKELEAMNGLNEYDYGARRREIGIPVWTTVDSKAEDYYSWSPYAYCRNNSICRIDPDGRADWEAVGEGAVATLGGGLLAAVGVGLCSTGIGVLGGGTLVILGTGIASVGAAKTFCGLVSDNSPQSKQALNRLPASAIETVGIIASEATGDKNAKTIATGVDLVISALTTNFKSISQMVSLAASTVSAVNASLNKSQSNSSAKIDNGKTTNSKSTSSKQSNSNSPIPPPKEELKIPSLIEITRHN